MTKVKNKALLGTLAALFANVLFGFSNMFSKLALQVAHPFFILTVRFTLSFIVLNLLALLPPFRLRLKGKNLVLPIILGLCQPLLYMIFELYGISLTSSAVSGVIISLSPVLVLIFSNLFLGEKPRAAQYIFALLSFVGVAGIALLSDNSDKTYFLGILLLILAAALAAAFNLLGRKIKDDFTPFERTYITFGVSFIGFQIALPFVMGADYIPAAVNAFSSTQFWGAIAYLSIGSSIIAFLLYNFAVSHISAVRASSFSNIITVVSVLAGVFILGESFTLWQVVGCALIIVGVSGVNLAYKK